MPHKVLITGPIDKETVKQLVAGLGGVNPDEILVEDIDRTRGEEAVAEKIEDVDILVGDFTFQIPITEKSLSRAKKLRLIQQPSAGFQQIDVKAAEKLGIPVCNTGSANAETVAEFTLMAALALIKNAYPYHEGLRKGAWVEPLAIQSRELKGKNFCILGLGRIGREVAARAKPFGVRLFYYDLFRQPAVEKEIPIEFMELDALLKKAEVLTVHVPLTSKTANLLSAERLELLPSQAVVVQMSRGGVVDEAALMERLKSNKLAGAWVDVFTSEPLPGDHPFTSCPRAFITPHMAGVTEEARMRIVQAAMSNIGRAVRGEPLQDMVKSYE